MRLIRPLVEEEMVSAFVQADYQAPRPGPRDCVRAVLGAHAERLILKPNHDDVEENVRRRHALIRSRNELRMLSDVCPSLEWRLVGISHAELGRFCLLWYKTFCQLAPRSRAVREAAVNVDDSSITVAEGLKERITALDHALALTSPSNYPPLIAVAPAEGAPHVLLDGNTRADAFIRSCSPTAEVEAMAGYHPDVPSWDFFGPS